MRASAEAKRRKQRESILPCANATACRAAVSDRQTDSRFSDGWNAVTTVVVHASVVIEWLLQDPEREAGTAKATQLMESVT